MIRSLDGRINWGYVIASGCILLAAVCFVALVWSLIC